MKQNYTHITLVVDRSGSMSAIKSDAEGGINAFVDEQKAFDGECTFTLYQFDNIIDRVYGPKDIREFEAYKLKPRNATAMLDAIGLAINETGGFLSAKKEEDRPEHVVFVIVTDGYENASREFTYDSIKKMVELQQNVYNWNFIFLAGDQDAVLTGEKIGTIYNTTYSNVGASTFAAYASTSASVANLRAGEALLVASVIDSEGNAV